VSWDRKEAASSGTRLTKRLSSPVGLAGCVLTLVLGVGAVCTFQSYRALRRAGEERASEALRERSGEVRAAFAGALGAADALLDRLSEQLRAHAELPDRASLLARMHALATARPGLTWLSLSFPDGTFAAVRLDDAGRPIGQTSDPREKVEYRFDERGEPVRTNIEPTEYDPRRRSFYRLALASGGRTWTEPYPFYSQRRTGVSRVEAVYRDAGDRASLLAVMTADFDATGLTRLLKQPMTPSQRQLVLTRDGAVLAADGVALPAGPPGEALHWSALRDPAVIAARAHVVPGAPLRSRTIDVAGRPWRLQEAEVASLDGQQVVLMSLLPEDELFARAHREALVGLLATLATALLGLALALVLSSNIARLRRQRHAAELEAQRARAEIVELGSYRLIELLGAGGMGTVYRARHQLLARDAALKLIRSGEASDEAEEEARKELFFREAKVLASLRSPNTVAVYDFGIADDGRYYLAMELLDGLDLERLVCEHGAQPPARVARILAQACDSLAEAHAAGLVHGDVKPANLFLCRLVSWLDVVKVLDFGLTRAVGTRVNAAKVQGTPAYMAPEQALGDPTSAASDLYALGCVGYWLLAGRRPYESEDPEGLLESHVIAPVPELPVSVLAATPPALVQLLTRCMAKHAEHRPSSAAALAHALRRVAAECAATYPDEARAAFWASRFAGPTATTPGVVTEPVLSVARDRELRAAG